MNAGSQVRLFTPPSVATHVHTATTPYLPSIHYSTSGLKIVLAIKKASHEVLMRQRQQLVSRKSQSTLKSGVVWRNSRRALDVGGDSFWAQE
jgi:hypothetical protein